MATRKNAAKKKRWPAGKWIKAKAVRIVKRGGKAVMEIKR